MSSRNSQRPDIRKFTKFVILKGKRESLNRLIAVFIDLERSDL
jgi:hypothetical protein